MIPDLICNLFDAFIGSSKQMFCTFQTNLLNIGRLSKTGLPFDQAVKVIFLIVEFIDQILDGHICIM